MHYRDCNQRQGTGRRFDHAGLCGQFLGSRMRAFENSKNFPLWEEELFTWEKKRPLRA
jgi:hypothetical protein